jgi:hypothetical protein
MRASVEAGGNGLLQCSQVGLSSSMISPFQLSCFVLVRHLVSAPRLDDDPTFEFIGLRGISHKFGGLMD